MGVPTMENPIKLDGLQWKIHLYFLDDLGNLGMPPFMETSKYTIIELDDGKIYRKPLYLMVKTMVSCRFSLKPIHRYYCISIVESRPSTAETRYNCCRRFDILEFATQVGVIWRFSP